MLLATEKQVYDFLGFPFVSCLDNSLNLGIYIILRNKIILLKLMQYMFRPTLKRLLHLSVILLVSNLFQ